MESKSSSKIKVWFDAGSRCCLPLHSLEDLRRSCRSHVETAWYRYSRKGCAGRFVVIRIVNMQRVAPPSRPMRDALEAKDLATSRPSLTKSLER
eukprot:s1034_g8.t1